MRHSYSAINTYESVCQRRHYLDKLHPQEFGGEAAERGSHVHNALEAVCREMASGATAEEAVERVCASPPEGSLPLKEIQGYITRALPVLKHIKPARGRVERWFRGVGDIEIAGKIDLISLWTPIFQFGEVVGHEERPCVIDWKTTSKPEKVPSQVEARRSRQLHIYCLAEEVDTAAFIYFLPEGDPMGVSVRFAEDELGKAQVSLKSICEEIEQKWDRGSEEAFNLHHRPGTGLCRGPEVSWGGCAHWHRCPAGGLKND